MSPLMFPWGVFGHSLAQWPVSWHLKHLSLSLSLLLELSLDLPFGVPGVLLRDLSRLSLSLKFPEKFLLKGLPLKEVFLLGNLPREKGLELRLPLGETEGLKGFLGAPLFILFTTIVKL